MAFVVSGALVLASRGGGRARWLLAAFAMLFGASYAVFNLVLPDALAPVLLETPLPLLGALVGLAFAWDLARPLPRRERAALALATILALGTIVLGAFLDATAVGERFGGKGAVALATGEGAEALGALSFALVLVCATCALRARREAGAGWVLLGLAFGLYPALNGQRFISEPFIARTWFATNALFSLAVALLWVIVRPRVGWAFLAAAFAGLLIGVYAPAHGNLNFDFGVNGIVRTLGALLLVLALLRHELVGVEPPAFAKRRGALAAGTLAVLIIVAQIAQNFFTARYGLIVGGVVAGAFLFAAKPIEGALERRRAEPAHGSDGEAKERSFIAAARRVHVHKGGVISREEERELMVLAEHLGIPASRAYELRDRIETER